MIVEEKFVNDDGKEKISARVRIKNLTFIQKNELRGKYVEPTLSGKEMILKDIPVNAFGMVQEAMTLAVKSVTLDGKWTDEDEKGEERTRTFEKETIKITNDADLNKIPEAVSEWLFSVVMEKLFRTRGQVAVESAGGASVAGENPVQEGVRPQLR